jgi:sporulation protein YhbH
MTRSIDRDAKRFNEIVRGKIRKDLKKYINHGEMIGRKGRETVSIPVPNIEIPHFRHGQKGSGGTGQGEGKVGQPIGRGQDDGQGAGEAGSEPGEHIREVEVTLDELAEMLAEQLELPNIIPKGKDSIRSKKDKYNTIGRTGPDSLRHFKRTYKEALKRQIASGKYDPKNPIIIPTAEDERFRSWKTVYEPQANAAILYIMDVSGSMTDEQKEIVRIEAFWIDTWLRSQYDGLERRYIVHDAVAHEVDEETFYRVRESGGTRISSAYKKAKLVIDRDFPPSDWNIYCFQFSDGDNWGEDNRDCLKTLLESLLPVSNLFCYGQVHSPYGSGDFIKELRRLGDKFENLVLSEIESKAAIYDSIKTFLGKGK